MSAAAGSSTVAPATKSVYCAATPFSEWKVTVYGPSHASEPSDALTGDSLEYASANHALESVAPDTGTANVEPEVFSPAALPTVKASSEAGSYEAATLNEFARISSVAAAEVETVVAPASVRLAPSATLTPTASGSRETSSCAVQSDG